MDANDIAEAIAYKSGYEKGKADALKWIPVTERLPEEYETVLVCGGGYVEPGWLGCDRVFYTHDKYESDTIYDVTHWMPLPQPPVDLTRMFENVSIDDLHSYREKINRRKENDYGMYVR